MIAELFDSTPKHRDNFIKLAEEGYFNDLLFHRIINNFMIQGGDPNSRGADMTVHLGSGGPGYQIDAEFTPTHAHVKGALAAARIGGPANPQKKSSGSQFYIVHGREVDDSTLQQFEARLGIKYPETIRQEYLKNGGVPFLDQEYTVFGQVIEGLEIIDKIAAVDTHPGDRPVENVAMKITVIK
ncbi:MAG: peptidylprolyl isomerase [Flavobacteriaceae bacterium]|nr:peptidylprolyl isomerase [Flavobacteriaceae bacterium]